MRFSSAGEHVAVESTLPWVSRIVARAAGQPVPDPQAPEPTVDTTAPTVRLRVESTTAAFDRAGLWPVTRGAYADGRRTLLTDAGGSGFDLLVTVTAADDDELKITARYRPSRLTRAANLALSSRFGLLAGQILVHYPVLWRAGWRGRVPLHASVMATAAGTPLIAGPGGVGKSTLLSAALRAGADATADNLCCADGTECFGVAEPLRVDDVATAGQRTSHGRVERRFDGRVEVLRPDRLVVLERGAYTDATSITSDDAIRSLVAGTYAAGELRRYWAFSATLALATGRGPAHPPIVEVASQYARRLPCVRIRVGDGDTAAAAALCGVDGMVTR
jgi:hypothetical protein